MKGESMGVGQLQRTWFELITSFFHEGFWDEQFAQLQQLQDESNPDFVVEVVTLFFDDSEKLLNDLARASCLRCLRQVKHECSLVKNKLEFLFKELDGEDVRLADYFDVITGTSTGGLVTAMLTVPNENGRPLFAAKDIKALFLNLSQNLPTMQINGKEERVVPINQFDLKYGWKFGHALQ